MSDKRPAALACGGGAAKVMDRPTGKHGSVVCGEEIGGGVPDIVHFFLNLFKPANSERFFRALESASSKQRVSGGNQKVFFDKCFQFAAASPDAVKKAWDAIAEQCSQEFPNEASVQKNAHPLASFIFWLITHCCIHHDSCAGKEYMADFVNQKNNSFETMANFLRILYEFRAWHLPERDFSKQKNQTQCMFDGAQHRYLFSLCDIEIEKYSAQPAGAFMSSEAAHTATGIALWCDTMVTAPAVKANERNALFDFVQNLMKSSDMTARWLRRETGRSYKLWGRMSKREYERCEVQKCSSNNKGEKWRHMIYAYALMSLLWSEYVLSPLQPCKIVTLLLRYNGNKEGPLGDYPDRRGSEMGRMIDRDEYSNVLKQLETDGASLNPQEFKQQLLKMLKEAEFVFPSKAAGVPADYNGHNIVALAVCKRGRILRIAYNHNTLFSSTVDHAEERLID